VLFSYPFVKRQATASKYIPELDGIRGIAILLVIAQHTIGKLVPFGFLGVDIFFVLSGFIIYETYFANEDFELKTFFIKRFARLYPALICVLLVNLIIPELRSLSSASNFLASVFYFKNFQFWDWPLGPYWSLSAEEQFYLISGIIVMIFYRSRNSKLWSLKPFQYILFILLTGLTVTGIILGTLAHTFNQPTILNIVLYRPSEIIFGVIVGVIIAKKNRKSKIIFKILAHDLTTLILIAITILSRVPTASAVLTMSMIAYVYANSSKSTTAMKFLRWEMLVSIGVLSYSIYIWHVTILVLTSSFFEHDPKINKIVSVLLIFIMSFISYSFLEVPARKYILNKVKY